MKKLAADIVHFFHRQGFIIVSTIDKNGYPHSSCKGLVHIDEDGNVYLIDLYRGETYRNLERNPRISITAVDEHKFKGYSLKGTSNMIPEKRIKSHIIKEWEARITGRVSRRVLKELRGGEEQARYPEILLPKPEYMIAMKVDEVIDLTPRPLK